MLGAPFALILLIGAGAGPNRGDATDAIVDGIRLWSEIRYRHPAVALGRVDWDQALMEAVPRLRAARTLADEHDALQGMLNHLGDPLTQMRGPEREEKQLETFDVQTLGDSTVVLALRPLHSGLALSAEVKRLEAQILKATRLVIDLRHQPPLWSTFMLTAGESLAELAPLLVPPGTPIPPTIVVERRGFRDELRQSSAYDTRWVLRPESMGSSRAPSGRRLVFIADSSSPIPPVVLGLVDAGRAQVVAVGPAGPGVTAYFELPVGAGLQALIAPRAILDDGWKPDVQLSPEQDGEALPTALRLLDAPAPYRQAKAMTEMLSKLGTEPLDRTYTNAHPPNVGGRILALARVWGTIHFFYPHLKLLDSNWDSVLTEFVPRMLAADTDATYAKTLLELTSHITDGHTLLWGPAVEEVIGPAWLPLDVLELDQGWTVVQVREPQIPIKAGEVIRGVDGVPLAERVRAMLPLCTGSTPRAHRRQAAFLALAGGTGSIAELDIWDGKTIRHLNVPRHWPEAVVANPSFHVLPDGSGYVDLTSLGVGDVPAMIAALRKAPAIIFDMRGYPNQTEGVLAAWLNRNLAKTASLGRQPWVVGDAPNGEVTWTYSVPLPVTADSQEPYQGRVVMLIDERAVSASEDTALFFESASDVLFVGSPTAGTDGMVTHLALPGGLFLRFTGVDFRHSDGRRLQRVGIQPDIFIRPTAAGLRSGRDEVLDRALLAIKRHERKRTARKQALLE